ncbi:hypothetical protein V8C86DRAFT_2613335 [Haematococcus lacustris]
MELAQLELRESADAAEVAEGVAGSARRCQGDGGASGYLRPCSPFLLAPGVPLWALRGPVAEPFRLLGVPPAAPMLNVGNVGSVAASGTAGQGAGGGAAGAGHTGLGPLATGSLKRPMPDVATSKTGKGLADAVEKDGCCGAVLTLAATELSLCALARTSWDVACCALLPLDRAPGDFRQSAGAKPAPMLNCTGAASVPLTVWPLAI